MTCATPAARFERRDPDEQPLGIDQLYAAYAGAHLSLGWAEFVLDHVVDRRDELIERYTTGDDDERTSRVIAWLRRLPDRR